MLYLYQVLGVRDLLLPESLSLTQGSSPQTPSRWSWEGDPEGQFVLFVPEPMSIQLSELWERIRQALKVSSVVYLRGEGSEEELTDLVSQITVKKGLVFGRQWAEQLGVGSLKLGQTQVFGGVNWKLTYGLADMLGSGREVAKKKKEAWEHMKELLK
ncbi:MAG: hypothetical protein H6624_08255 [Bdellovibrionaceae bacterium]|nr:hypothetical protein [Bdellovibrionales bacterium]MCB9084324.1 hypothetical protein [Pseudobdellovibrionaceae bacterium]